MNADQVLDKTSTTDKKHTMTKGESLRIRNLFLCIVMAAIKQVDSQKARVKPPPTNTVGLKPPPRMFCIKSEPW